VSKEIKKKPQLELNPNVSVDCVIFGFDFDKLNVLVINRSEKEGIQWALPGNLIYDAEHLDEAANRVLEELTGLKKNIP